MNDLTQVLKKDTLLIIEIGEYSDRSWFQPIKMLADYSKEELVKEFRNSFIPTYPGDEPEPYDFLPWLVKSGKAEHLEEVHSWHIGSYGYFDP